MFISAHAASTSVQQVTPELWVLSTKCASYHFQACRIWGWLLDFWKICALLHYCLHGLHYLTIY